MRSTDENPNGRNKLFHVQGALMIIIVAGYVGLTAYAMVRWNESISASLVTGFVLFAQSATARFFTWLETQPPNASKVTETTTTSHA